MSRTDRGAARRPARPNDAAHLPGARPVPELPYTNVTPHIAYNTIDASRNIADITLEHPSLAAGA